MIDYRKASSECRDAYFKYIETTSEQPSATSFVAGWNAAMASMGGAMEATQCDNAECIHSEEPAKEPEPEHPAGPMPNPGEWYRVLTKNPPEDLQDGDEYFGRWDGLWRKSRDASDGLREQHEGRWYRRKIDHQPSFKEN